MSETSKRGLYRTADPLVGVCAFTHWSAGDAHPFVPRDIYLVAKFDPPFDDLPTQEEYDRHWLADD